MSGLSQKPGCDAEFQKGLTEEALLDVKKHRFSESPRSVTKGKKFHRESRNATTTLKIMATEPKR